MADNANVAAQRAESFQNSLDHATYLASKLTKLEPKKIPK